MACKRSPAAPPSAAWPRSRARPHRCSPSAHPGSRRAALPHPGPHRVRARSQTTGIEPDRADNNGQADSQVSDPTGATKQVRQPRRSGFGPLIQHPRRIHTQGRWRERSQARSRVEPRSPRASRKEACGLSVPPAALQRPPRMGAPCEEAEWRCRTFAVDTSGAGRLGASRPSPRWDGEPPQPVRAIRSWPVPWYTSGTHQHGFGWPRTGRSGQQRETDAAGQPWSAIRR
jgi:hypothetical protein